MKDVLIFLIFCCAVILCAFIPGEEKSFSPMFYKYNAGSAPTRGWENRVFYGTATTTSGVATFQVTDNGQAGGNALYTDLANAMIYATARANTGTAISVPLSSIKAIASGKTVTVNAVDGLTAILASPTMEFSNDGTQIDILIIGQ